MTEMTTQHLLLVEGAATYERILEAVRNDDLEEGIYYIKDFLKIYPEFAKAHNDLAVLYHRSGDSLKALAHFEKAVKLEPKNVTYQKNLADFYFVEIEWTGEAVHIYSDIVKDNPLDTEALNALGTISLQIGRKERARKYFTNTLQVDPSNQEARQALQQLAAGSAPVQIPLSPHPEPQWAPAPPPPPQKSDGELYRESLQATERVTERMAILQQLLAQNPDHAAAHNDLGVLCQQQGDAATSRQHHEAAARIEPGNALYRKNLADLLCVEFGDLEAALQIYIDLFAKDRYDVEIIKSIAQICLHAGKLDDARFFVQQALNLQPWDREAIEALKAIDNPAPPGDRA